MRSHPTEAERKLWMLLRGKRLTGFKFKRQQPIAPYIVDFVCFEQRVIVEVDGSQHVGSAYDAKRDDWLKSQGFKVLRLWNNDVLNNEEGVLAAIMAALEVDKAASSRLGD
ncbi:MAG: endonuclease domain-containing protein [Pseudomonadota bacterium]|jgi:very-short-patch-repair endonuclease